MNLKPVILSEVRKKKQISYINAIYKIYKMVLMDLILEKEWRCRYRNGLVNTIEEGKSVTNGENSVNIYKVSYLK